jgi:predicted nucleic acid-binding protein
MSKGRRARLHVAGLINHVRTSPVWEVIPFSEEIFDRALALHSQYIDKEWTLTDCTSFVVMRDRGITEALTGDRHFEQVGFTAPLK